VTEFNFSHMKGTASVVATQKTPASCMLTTNWNLNTASN